MRKTSRRQEAESKAIACKNREPKHFEKGYRLHAIKEAMSVREKGNIVEGSLREEKSRG